jgi:hypothetical protein
MTGAPDEKPGNGRWSIPLYLLKSRKFMNRVRTLAAQLFKDVKELQGSERNPDENREKLMANGSNGFDTCPYF